MRRRASGSVTSYDLETNKDAAQLRGEDRPSRLDVLDEIVPRGWRRSDPTATWWVPSAFHDRRYE
jgi:hypothetical protein